MSARRPFGHGDTLPEPLADNPQAEQERKEVAASFPAEADQLNAVEMLLEYFAEQALHAEALQLRAWCRGQAQGYLEHRLPVRACSQDLWALQGRPLAKMPWTEAEEHFADSRYSLAFQDVWPARYENPVGSSAVQAFQGAQAGMDASLVRVFPDAQLVLDS